MKKYLTYKEIVSIYHTIKRFGIQRELAICRMVSDACKFSDKERAEIALMGSHQWHLNIDTRCMARDLTIEKLAKSHLWNNQYSTFEKLYDDVCKVLNGVPYIRFITKYDVAKRIGVMIKPEITPVSYVYLHAGALDGAERLLNTHIGQDQIRMDSQVFAKYFGDLSPIFVEDLLCTMKNYFANGNIVYPQSDKKSSGCHKLYCSKELKEKINKELNCKSK